MPQLNDLLTFQGPQPPATVRRAGRIQEGQRFGQLVALRRHESRRAGVYWRCLCDCGKDTIVRADNLRSGATSSCGSRCKLKQAFPEDPVTPDGTTPASIELLEYSATFLVQTLHRSQLQEALDRTQEDEQLHGPSNPLLSHLWDMLQEAVGHLPDIEVPNMQVRDDVIFTITGPSPQLIMAGLYACRAAVKEWAKLHDIHDL